MDAVAELFSDIESREDGRAPHHEKLRDLCGEPEAVEVVVLSRLDENIGQMKDIDELIARDNSETGFEIVSVEGEPFVSSFVNVAGAEEAPADTTLVQIV